MRELERRVLLSVLDRKWREHLYEMDYLQEGIGLRAMGQRDPLVEYQREGFDMFISMMEAIKEESVGFLFNVDVQVEQAPSAPVLDLNALVATGPGEGPGEVIAEHLLGDEPGFEPAVQSPPQPTVAPVGVAGEPVPSEAPAARNVLPDSFGRPNRPANLEYTAPSVDAPDGVQRSTGPMSLTSVGEGKRPGEASGGEQSRNALCACGSGKKFKRCHGDPRNR